MATKNNLKGSLVKDFKVVYSEKLKNNLYVKVIMKYMPFYDGKNRSNYQCSSQIEIESVVTSGGTYEYSNGTHAIEPKETIERIGKDESFRKLESFVADSGIKIRETAYAYSSGDDYKSRRVIWLAEINKDDLLKMCLNN